jgi:hypothetical protein
MPSSSPNESISINKMNRTAFILSFLFPILLIGEAHWSLVPPERPSSGKSIDEFIEKRLSGKRLKQSEEASRRILIRRMYLDMLGLVPTPEEIDAFVADEKEDAYGRLVEKALNSASYGERWARHWLDVVRYADSAGFETNHERPNAYHYRDYVIRAFNEDKPYDQFVFEQIAGDIVGEDAATGFIVAGPNDRVGGQDPILAKQQRANELADMVGVTGSAFLGLTVACARCHDHKFDPISQVDFYSMQAIFEGVKHGERNLPLTAEQKKHFGEMTTEKNDLHARLKKFIPLADGKSLRSPVNFKRNLEHFDAVEARFIRFTAEATTNNSEPCIDELEAWTTGKDSKNVAPGAKLISSGDYANNPKHKLIHLNDGKYGNDRSWISSQKGKGWAQLELSQPATIERIEWGRDRTGRLKDRLPTKYRIEVATELNKWTLVASSQSRKPFDKAKTTEPIFDFAGHPEPEAEEGRAWLAKLNELEKKTEALSKTSKVYAGTFQQPVPTKVMYRGDPLAPREVVAPEGLSALKSLLKPLGMKPDAPERDRRVALAKWMTHPKNPLTARVMVNRIWHGHFGRGIVATPSNFGDMGFRPTHPRLLDWLAMEFMENGWSVKHIHRLILNSKTYRQASLPRKDALAKDAGTELLWRFPPRRLEAEAIRDNALLLAGALDKKMYGPGFLLFVPNANYARNWVAKDEFKPSDMRRMIYTMRIRMEQDAIFGAFDCPDGGQVAPNRSRSTTPIQALNLYNSGFMADLSKRFAERIAKEAGEDPRKQISRAFAWTFGRSPQVEETMETLAYLEEHGLPALCRVLLNANEFLFVQ